MLRSLRPHLHMFSLQPNSRNVSWQLSSIEGREGGKLVERRDQQEGRTPSLPGGKIK